MIEDILITVGLISLAPIAFALLALPFIVASKVIDYAKR